MSKFLYRVGSWSYRKVWPFLAFWLVLLIAMGGLAAGFAKSPNPSFSMPDMDSTVTMEQMNERFGEGAGSARVLPSGASMTTLAVGASMDPAPSPKSTSSSLISRTPARSPTPTRS